MSFKHKNDVTLSNAMNDVIFLLQMTSASTHFPRTFKTVNYCLIYHTFFALTLYARCVRTSLIFFLKKEKEDEE